MFPELSEIDKYFHEMFRFRWDEYRRSGSTLVVNPTRKRKKFASEDGATLKPLDFEILGNISSFGIYEISRLAVFEKFLRRSSYLHLHLQALTEATAENSSSETDDFQHELQPPEIKDVSKVVKIGVRSIFELIKGSRVEFPDLCVKAIGSLLGLLEGLQLEALSDEPNDIMGDIFNILLNVVDECLNDDIAEKPTNVDRLVEIASACLLSFAIIRGDTGKMLKAISTILISKYSTRYKMVLPNAVIELQRSVQSFITGQLKHPNWFTHGVLKSSCISTFQLLFTPDAAVNAPLQIKSIACDGHFLFVYTSYGLYKIGTGFNGTIRRKIYASNSDFFGFENGCINYVKKILYFSLSKTNGVSEAYTVNKDTLQIESMINLDVNVGNLSQGLLFVDGDHVCLSSSPNEDVLNIRYLELQDGKLSASPDDLRLELSERYFKLLGTACGNDEFILSPIGVGVNEELVAFASGKEFSLLQTASGKVFYNSKLGNQNLRAQAGRNVQNWMELICPKMSMIKQCVIGNEGSIGLLVHNDGSVYFIGFARRGEDGENGVVRRQCSQVKPRRMTRMEGKFVTYAACNHGSTALVTDKGELYMFGKDAIHCEMGTGFVSDLKNVRVKQVALGKVHVLVLTDRGQVYTFGYNGREQCGRYSDSGRYEEYLEAIAEDDETSASSEDTYSDIVCPKGTHVFKQDKCMICPICHQCTGYGGSCLASNEEIREPCNECGCGDGDSGCAKCCICKICAFEDEPEHDSEELNEINNLFAFRKNEKKGQSEFSKEKDNADGFSHDEKSQERSSNANIAGTDSSNMIYLTPARVHFRTNSVAVQIATGLYHSVVLMENGDVYAFGSNTFGQLGVSDISHVGPTKALLPSTIVQIAAGSNHTVAMTSEGQVYTFGNNSSYQINDGPANLIRTEESSWNSVPKLIPQVGSQYYEKAVGIGASGDVTYLKMDRSLINSSTPQKSIFLADKSHILLLPVSSSEPKPFECIAIEKTSGKFKSFHGPDQVDFTNCVVCFDPLYNVIWSVNEMDSAERRATVSCYNVIASDVKEEFCSPNVLDCELAVPVIALHPLPCYQTAIHVLACLDMLAQARARKDALKSLFTEQKRVTNVKSLRKEDYSTVNRFQGLGNSWTYNTHNAVEAIRFSCDTDVLLGGVGLYGGRGHYHARIKLYDEGIESDPEFKNGQLLISTDESVYECSLKQIYSFMFEEPVLLQANKWYVLWAQVKGSPSDCGSSGQSYVVTEDEVVFHFKSSSLSNNGTNLSSGQIPQLLYKILTPEFYVVTNFENSPSVTVHILSKKFSHSVSEDGFKSLIHLLSWCWKAFKLKYAEISNLKYSPLLLESVRLFDRLVYINQACQRLMRAFIFEMYPDDCVVRERKTRVNQAMAELMGDVRELLQHILSDQFLFENFIPKKETDGSGNIFHKLVKHILKECSDTFVSCFYVFYPTPSQKWIYLCYLLNFRPENSCAHDFLITATLSALYASNCNLKSIFPILLGAFDPNQLFQQNKSSLPLYFHNYHPVLAECMTMRTETEIPISTCSWLDIVDKLLEMASKPSEDNLCGVRNMHDTNIAHHSCQVLSKLVAELSAEAMGINDDVQKRKAQMLHTTPIRFRRVNSNKTWNTGNGSPDAICFSVNKAGVVVVGVGVFGGSGNYDYEIELMEEVLGKCKSSSEHNLSHLHAQHWKCIAMCRGSFSSTDYNNGKDIVELNFEYPTTLQENVKYAIKLRLRGNRTNNGELGQAMVTGPDDTIFTYLNTDVSFNGTSISRGQLPYIIYYRHLQRSDEELKQKMSLEMQAREAIVGISSKIFADIINVLQKVTGQSNYKDWADALGEVPLIKVLVPLLITHLSPLVALNPKNACQLLKLIEKVLPLVCSINRQIAKSARDLAKSSASDSASSSQITPNLLTTSPHYSIVESDHPYKRATVSKYVVKFPESVLWLSLEFDPRCGTTQEEDVLKIYVPDYVNDTDATKRKLYRPLPRTYGNNKHSWPDTAIILPGNEVIFSLESASKYSSHDRGTSFGFRCLVIGFGMVNIDGLPRLELELNALACRCASYLIKKKYLNSLYEDEFGTDSINIELAESDYKLHPSILNLGMDLYREETVKEDHPNWKTSGQLSERSFLLDFISYKADTSGGRLARWLQPDSFVDVKKCEVVLPRAKIRCGWPTSLAVVTRDQYGDIIEVPDLKVKVVCTPLTKVYPPSNHNQSTDNLADRKLDYSIPYKPVTSNRAVYASITFMKEYNNYSFEEIRYETPNTTAESEHPSILANHNGIFTANWTAKEVGSYSVSVNIDGYLMTEFDAKIDVKMPPFGLTPPVYTKSSSVSFVEKKLKFVKRYSCGLRVRAQPSLQAEQIGIVAQDGIVKYNDEVENEDGIWVKLTHQCITQYCKQLFPEAWSLKYNKHYECELLFCFDDQPQQQPHHHQSNNKRVEKVRKNVAASSNGNSEVKVYRVIKCGISGHNIRAYPSLKAPTVGMIFAEQKVTSDEQILNKEGMWIKLDKDVLKKFDLSVPENESVWSLAIDKSQIVYLKADSNGSKEYSGRKERRRSRSSSRNSTPVPEIDTNEESNEVIEDSRMFNQNVMNFNVPPTPKKQRRPPILSSSNVTSTPTTTTDRTDSSSGLINTSDLADASSSCSSSDDGEGRSTSPHFDSLIEKLKRATNECLAFDIGVSTISEGSGAISSGYQASVETSSDSNALFKSQNYQVEEKPRPHLAQAGTQTSPRIYVKTPSRKHSARNVVPEPAPFLPAGNLNVPDEELSKNVRDIDKLFEDSILRVETIERVPMTKHGKGQHKVSGGNANENNDEDDDSVMFFTGATTIQLRNLPKADDSNRPTNGNEYEKQFHASAPFSENFTKEDDVEKLLHMKDSKAQQYKIGMCPSVAESVRAVFAAFLWHEGLVHDAMTCASYLKFHPDLRKDEKVVVRREQKTRCKDVTQRYSVEVGLSGNCHHPIKPSTMRSLSSKHGDTAAAEDETHVPQVPPMALEYIANLWNEIANTCQQLFSKNTTYATVYKSGNENREPNLTKGGHHLDDGKKYVSKLASDFYKKFGPEDLCELCSARFPFPVTYHMRHAHKGCGKLGVTEGYSMYGKHSAKLKGYCGEGGKKNSLWYVLCEECREQCLLQRKKASSFIGFSPVSEESIPVQVSTETHLIMRDNALFALELSGNYNKLMPIVQTLPRLRKFGCLPTFGIDSEVIPSEVNSFTMEWEKQVRPKTDADGDKEEAFNVVNSYQRSVSMIGRSWKVEEDYEGGDFDVSNLSSSPVVPNKRYSAYDLEKANFSSASYSSAKLEALLREMRSSSSSGAKDRPIISFLSEYHNLHNLRSTIKAIIKKAMYKNYGLRAMDWLLHTVTSPIALHDIMWWFMHSFSVPLQTEDTQNEADGEWNDEFDLTQICEHPLVDMALAGEARHYIPSSFHSLLQTIADLMLIFPVGSPLQQIAIKCWGFQFTQSDYNFLHKSKLFVNISKILSRSESEEEQECANTSLYESHPSTVSQTDHYVEVLRDVTSYVSISVSSHSHLLNNLIDNSTETYWESGEEDRRKMKTIVVNCPPEVNPRIVYLHADNTRDTNHKLQNVMILVGKHADSPRKLKTVNLDSEFCGWITFFIPESHQRLIRVDCKGDNVLRVRQIKLSGEIDGESPRILQMPCSFTLQQRQCESETLKVFRLIIFQVFGELIESSQSDSQRGSEQRGSSDLKEHMVGILFSRRKLNNLQKQVCTHIVQTIKQETAVLREEWERHTNTYEPGSDFVQYDVNDSYCFEMLCMLSALSGSDVGRSYLAQQLDLIADLLTLLHVGTTRLQRQVVLLLKRVLPEVSPVMLAQITKVHSLPVVDFRALISDDAATFDPNKQGILNIFLSVLAKNLSMQMKAKSGSNGKALKTVYMSDYLHPRSLSSDQWYYKGTICKELSVEVNSLLKDMTKGKISFDWQETSKAAIAENILNLSNLNKVTKDHYQCLKSSLFWIGLASLTVIDEEHVEKLSSANWRNMENGSASSRAICSNHDDGKTLAMMQCNVCGLLCLECDRFLHLSRRSATHERRVCKEEEEAIKVNLYEGCGRVKLFWLLALVDSNTFKGVIEFRENTKFLNNVAKTSGVNSGACRFCGKADDKLTQHGTCCDQECLQHVSMACNKVHQCGHICGGIRDEDVCLPCLQGCSAGNATLKQDADDMCMICFTEALCAAPSIQLECGHVFHYHCCENVLLRRWPGPRITFNFQQCPICKRSMYHDSMKQLLLPIWDLIKEVRKKALMRLEYEGCPSNYDDPAVYAMEKYAYYVCFKCKKAYYGGEARCEAEVDNSDFNVEELICGGCSDVSRARVCPKHGIDFLEYKCRYCCSVAVYFCFGTTHFCNACHEDFQKVIYMSAAELPKCPAGPKGTSLKMEDCPLHIKHPPTGEEFALGCGVCRTGRNF